MSRDHGVSITFHGGASTVTGSKALVRWPGGQVLVDCGLFQGFKHHRLLNWQDLPFDPQALDAVLLTHAHLDHSGALPVLARAGYRGPIHATQGTRRLAQILLDDAAHIQEEQAERANRRGYSKHKPALPLYTKEDAAQAHSQIEGHDFDTPIQLPGGATATFRRAGHILGASMVLIEVAGRRLLFTGDVGRPHDPIHPAPAPLPEATVVVMESTYGNREHEPTDVEAELGAVIQRTVARGGHVMIPAFAVGRTQRVLYHLYRLSQQGKIPHDVPIWLNSPLASKATEIFRVWHDEATLDDQTAERVCRLPRIAETADDSRRLNQLTQPSILIAGSGMATGGRILHHMLHYAPSPKHTLLFTGFAAGGTRAARILAGERETRIFGQTVPIRCEVCTLHDLSAHADRSDLIDWLRAGPRPGRVLLNHGEPDAADSLRQAIAQALDLEATVPLMGQTFEV